MLSQQVEKEKEEGNQQERPGLSFPLELVKIVRDLEGELAPACIQPPNAMLSC